MDYQIAVFGNPILDLITTYSKEWFDHYQLKPGGYCMYDGAIHNDIFDKLQDIQMKEKLTILPGGAAQNTARVCQLLLRSQAKSSDTVPIVAYFGAIGGIANGSLKPDNFGQIMWDLTKDSGVAAFYQVVPGISSGSCAVCISSETKDRSMVTKLGASQCFDPTLMDKHWDIILRVPILHISGFFVSASLTLIDRLIEFAKKDGTKIVSFSLCAPFIVSSYRDKISGWLKSIQVVVGDELEWKQLKEEFFPNELYTAEETLKHVCGELMFDSTSGCERPKLAICTRGADSTLIAIAHTVDNIPIMEVDPIKINSEHIVDTNGCGDAFLGGLLAGIISHATLKNWLQKGQLASSCDIILPLEKSIQSGHQAAHHVLRKHGCDLRGYLINHEL